MAPANNGTVETSPLAKLAGAEGQDEGGQIRFTDSDHHAGCRSLGSRGAKILAQRVQLRLTFSNTCKKEDEIKRGGGFLVVSSRRVGGR